MIEGPIVNDTLDYPIYTSILGIEPAMGSDTGSYQCYAYNSVGNYTAVGDLIVQGESMRMSSNIYMIIHSIIYLYSII